VPTYGVGFSAFGGLGGSGGGNINTPTNNDGVNTGVAFGGLSNTYVPPPPQ
jgi:hypothetical protein